jgi:uncharacterized membrane protein YdcZ (DUF606 family)
MLPLHRIYAAVCFSFILVAALLVDHFGVLTGTPHAFSVLRTIGFAFVAAGVWFVVAFG